MHPRNNEYYMMEADVERQKTLESYGYKFLRLNRFNIGDNPMVTLLQRSESLVNTPDVEVRAVVLDAELR